MTTMKQIPIAQIIKNRKQADYWKLPIKEPYRCDHSYKELRRQTHGAFVLQCPECGSTCSTSIAHKTLTIEQRDNAEKFDYERQRSGYDFASESRGVERSHGIKDTESSLAIEYQEYLRSEQWRAKRQMIIKREKNICQGCHNNPIEEVHHATYSNIGDELLFQLVGLCSDCHRRTHKK